MMAANGDNYIDYWYPDLDSVVFHVRQEVHLCLADKFSSGTWYHTRPPSEETSTDSGHRPPPEEAQPVDVSTMHRTWGGLLEGSCQWILDHADYQRWYSEEQSRPLWIKGDPGTGKTMLPCAIVDELTRSIPHVAAVSFFF
ncbi:hypothetical protein GE09DRAFT_1267724 [Coniochaeta sp. 2T2.1]|nr:hypothetical protein GE09DRAFT_1267724 [Coniochaeta sp. 2T2.1]